MNPITLNSLLMMVEDNIYLSTNQTICSVFRFEGLPCYGMSQSEYTDIMIKSMDLLNQLDTDIEVSFVTRNKHDKHTLNQFLDKMTYSSSRKKWMESVYQNSRFIETFLIISLPSKNGAVSFLNPAKFPLKKRVSHLKKEAETIYQGFEKIGFNLGHVSLDEVGQWCYHHLNLDEHSELQIQTDPIFSDSNASGSRYPTIREQVLHETMEIGERYLKIGDTYHAILSLDLMGTHSDIYFYQQLHNLFENTDHEIVVSFKRKDKDTYTKKLFQNQKDMQATLQIKKENISDFDANRVGSRKQIYADQVALMDDISSFPLEVFELSFSITCRADSEKSLAEIVKQTIKTLQSNQFHHTVFRESGTLTPSLYHAFLPGNQHQLVDKVVCTTLQLLYFLPINRYYKGYTAITPMQRVNQLYKTPNNEIACTHSFYFGSNFRIQEVTATTGSGKSFDLIKQIDGILSEKIDVKPIVLVVEPKRGMLKLTRLYNGEIVNYNPSSTKSFNPFPKKKTLMLPEGLDYEGFAIKQGFDPMLLAYFENLLEILVKEDSKPTLSARMKGIINEIIRNRYEEEDDDFVLILPDIIEKLDTYKPDDDDAFVQEINRVKGNLERYVAPQYENLFLKREPLNLANDLVYFDLSAVDDNRELKELGLYILGSSMIQKLRVKNRPTYLYLDEASVFYQTEVGATLLEFFVRQARSLGGSVTIATQSAQDKLKSSVGDILGENISIRKCLYLENGHDNLERVGFLEPEVQLIKRLKKRPGYFVEQFQRLAGIPMLKRSQPDPFLYWLSTNDETDDQYFYTLQEQHTEMEIEELIEMCAREKPNGA